MLSTKKSVGFDISQTGKQKAGCGYFSYALLNALQQYEDNIDWHLFPHFGTFHYDAFMPWKNPFPFGKYGPRIQTNFQVKKFWDSSNLQAKLKKIDILHANNFWCPTQLNHTKLIYTLYDLGFIENHQWTTEHNRIGCLDGVFKASLYADGIIAISEYSKNHFLKIFPYFPEERLEVIYPCSRFENSFSKDKPNRLNHLNKNQFWLSVGTIEPRKNQKFLLDVYAEYLKKTHFKFPLVLAGQKGWLVDDFEDYLKKLNIEENVIVLGYVSDEELSWLYQNCFVNLYPSSFEGFGLPVLEALELGAATLTNKNTSMDEIIYSEGQLSLNDKNQWLDKMLAFHEPCNLRDLMINKGFQQAKKFTWNNSAKKTINFYQKILKMPKYCKK